MGDGGCWNGQRVGLPGDGDGVVPGYGLHPIQNPMAPDGFKAMNPAPSPNFEGAILIHRGRSTDIVIPARALRRMSGPLVLPEAQVPVSGKTIRLNGTVMPSYVAPIYDRGLGPVGALADFTQPPTDLILARGRTPSS